MATAMHIELDALFLLILAVIAFQISRSVSKQMRRILFRYTVYGIIITLGLDILWMLVDGQQFPGGILLNKVINALFLGAGVIMGCVWYLYVLETLGYRLTRWLKCVVMFPGLFFMALNIISIWTEWTFTVNEQNIYIRGPLFWLQTGGALLMLFVSFFHILIDLMRPGKREVRKEAAKLLRFYIVPVIGTLVSMPYTGMPGTWTCAAVSVVLIYMDDQDQEILRDSLTGLNNRKTLGTVFADYVKQAGPQRELFLFMMDLDDFKAINDTYGHSVGDQALVAAAGLLTASVAGRRAIVARYGGDEFLVMGFFTDDQDARNYKMQLLQAFRGFNREGRLPCRVNISIGFAPYMPGQDLGTLVNLADTALYRIKGRER